MEWRENLHRLVRMALKDIPPAVIDAIDAAYIAGMDGAKRCTKCNSPFEKHHHRHIVGDKIFHTHCYKAYQHTKR